MKKVTPTKRTSTSTKRSAPAAKVLTKEVAVAQGRKALHQVAVFAKDKPLAAAAAAAVIGVGAGFLAGVASRPSSKAPDRE